MSCPLRLQEGSEYELSTTKKTNECQSFCFCVFQLLPLPIEKSVWKLLNVCKRRYSHFLPHCGTLFILVSWRVPRTRSQSKVETKEIMRNCGLHCIHPSWCMKRHCVAERILTMLSHEMLCVVFSVLGYGVKDL